MTENRQAWIFLLAGGVLMIMSVWNLLTGTGEARFGRIFARSDDPFRFWFQVIFFAAVGSVVFVEAVRYLNAANWPNPF